MPPDKPIPPLKSLHSQETLIRSKLIMFEGLATDDIVHSLAPGCANCLKARPDGTIIDGHHRIYVLRTRGVDVNSLPREIIEKEGLA